MLGYRVIRLDTNAALAEAIALYQRAGYRAVERYNDNPWATHFFEKVTEPAGSPEWGIQSPATGVVLPCDGGLRLT